jgi:hypothetical protein
MMVTFCCRQLLFGGGGALFKVQTVQVFNGSHLGLLGAAF